MRRLLVDANPMAYGSSSAALAILDHVQATRVALVRDVSAELLGNDPAVDSTIAVDVKDTTAVRAAIEDAGFDGALVVSNLTNVELYDAIGLPIVFVDILFWYSSNKSHRAWAIATRSFVQDFPGVADRLRDESLGSAVPPVIVGPLIRPCRRASGGSTGSLVNLGGGRSRWILPSRDDTYVRIVARILDALTPSLPQPVVLATGRDAAAALTRTTSSRWEGTSFAQHAYLDALGRSEVLFTAPGLNAVFEGLGGGVPCVFLPPQNASQVLQLARYERAGLLDPGLNLPDLVDGHDLPLRVADEEAYTMAVLDGLRSILASETAMKRVIEHVRQQLATVHERAEARRAFWTSLEPPGASTVASAINSLLDTSSP